jgi:dihydroorotate dehydrogenase (fumarate)
MDLRTVYMGLELKNPIVPSASPLSESLDGIKRMADAGASAVVLFSLFEEQLQHEQTALQEYLSAGTESFSEALSYFPATADYRVGPESYLDLIHEASEAVDIPVLGSLNGVSDTGWVEYARKMQDAGAKGLELNVYYVATDPKRSSGDVEKMYLEVLQAVKGSVSIPVALKLSPFFTSMAHVAEVFAGAGADALVLFNRFYQPDFNLDQLSVETTLDLSRPAEIRLPLRWIAILRGRLSCSLGATSGVHTVDEVAKYLLAGADVVMSASALLEKGIGHIGTLVADLATWMEQHEYASVEQMKGAMSQKSVADPMAYERANYIKILERYKQEYTLGD